MAMPKVAITTITFVVMVPFLPHTLLTRAPYVLPRERIFSSLATSVSMTADTTIVR